MKEYEKRAIYRNWVHLINNLFAKDLTKYFIQEEILTLDDCEKIRSNNTSCEQNESFLSMIIKKGADSFATLVDALRRENDNDTAELLENTIRNDQGPPIRCEVQCPKCRIPLVCPICSKTEQRRSSCPLLIIHRNDTEMEDLTLRKTPYTPSADQTGIELKSALDLTEEEVRVDPVAEKDKHFQYYHSHLRHEAGWHPGVYKIEDIENILKDKCSKTETGQYLIWYEGEKYGVPFISVHCQGIIHHFRIEMSPSTETKKKIFYIDREWEFHKLEELLSHVKTNGISLDKEFRPEAGLF